MTTIRLRSQVELTKAMNDLYGLPTEHHTRCHTHGYGWTAACSCGWNTAGRKKGQKGRKRAARAARAHLCEQ